VIVTTSVVGTTGGSALWYLARASGVVSLVLLTGTVLLGILTSFRWSSPKWPRFVVELVHRNLSLLVVVFLAIHIVTVVADPYAPIRWVDAVVPFVSAYRPLWLGFGALAFDMLVALIVTSLLRHRIGYRAWRVVHWFAYACWPVAVVHGLGTGTDTPSGAILLLTLACVGAVLVAGALRLASGLARHPGIRPMGLAGVVLAPVLLMTWLWNGPLASGWARRAGTPTDLLARTAAAGAPTSGGAAGEASPAAPPGELQASLTGTVRTSSPDVRGDVVVSLVGDLADGRSGHVVELTGRPVDGGGVQLASGTVTLTADGLRTAGKVSGVEGATVFADLTTATGTAQQLVVRFTQLDQPDGRMAGVVDVRSTREHDREGNGQ